MSGLLEQPDAAGEGDLGLYVDVFRAVALQRVGRCEGEGVPGRADVAGAQVAAQRRPPGVVSTGQEQDPDGGSVV